MVLWIALIIVSLYAAGITYAAVNLLRKNEAYEDWVVSLARQVSSAYQRMRNIDANQIFEKDDDVGATFEDLKNVVYELQGYTLENEEETDEA